MFQFVQPFGLLYLANGLAILALWRRRREPRRRLAPLTIAFALLYLISTPVVGALSVGTLEWGYPPRTPAEALDGAQAIVVLGGYAFPSDGQRTRPSLAHDSLYRCLHALELHQQGPAMPIVTCGGQVNENLDDPPVAAVMRDFLAQAGVDPTNVIVEGRSRSTHENAAEAAKILKARGLTRIALVTEAYHLPRAARCFVKEGLEVHPAGCRYRARTVEWQPIGFFPNPRAADGVLLACHEWLGMAWYWWNGWI